MFHLKPQGLCALGYILRVTWWHLVVWCVALERSMMVLIEASIHRGSKLDMAASVYVDSVAGSVSSPTLLSSGAVVFVLLMKQTGQEA